MISLVSMVGMRGDMCSQGVGKWNEISVMKFFVESFMHLLQCVGRLLIGYMLLLRCFGYDFKCRIEFHRSMSEIITNNQVQKLDPKITWTIVSSLRNQCYSRPIYKYLLDDFKYCPV